MRMILVAAIVAAAVISSQAQAPADKTELEGNWDAVYSVTGTQPPFQLEPGLVTLQFQGSKLMALNLLPMRGPAFTKPVKLAFSVDTKAMPRQIDYWELWETGKPPVRFGAPNKILAIYELKGDELRIVIPSCNDTGPRPKSVSGEICAVLLVLKRR